MKNTDEANELQRLRTQNKHLRNELQVTKEENEAAVLNYYDLYKNMETLVEERTKQLRSAMSTIYKYNHRLEEMLEERTKHLIKTERHAAFSLLSQGIVHNLKNPLSIISGAYQLLKFSRDTLNETELSENTVSFVQQVDKNVDKIEIGTNRMLDMINSLMAKSRNDTCETQQNINLNEILKKKIEFLNADSVFKNKVTKNIEFKNEDIYTRVLPGELSQIFQNLIRNALDALYHTPNPEITVKTGVCDKEVWFAIKDNGPGIEDDKQGKIFDPFFSTKPKADTKTKGEPTGTGLGLHMCSQMVTNNKGRIELYSKKGDGAEFKVYFPKTDSKGQTLIMN